MSAPASGRTPAAPPATQVAALLALFGAQVAFGLFPIFGRYVFGPGGLSPLGVATWRLGGGAGILGALAFARHGRAMIPAARDITRLVIAALLGVALNQGLFLEGLARSTPLNSTLVMCLIPIFTFVIAAATGAETFSARRLVGVLIGLGGLAALLLDEGLHGLGRYGVGNLLMMVNALCYSGYLVLSKPLVRRYPPLVVIAWAYLFSLPFLFYFARASRLLPEPGHPAMWWSLVYIVVFPTVLSYLLNMFALARVRASTAAFFVYAQPLVTAFASWIVFAEEPTLKMLGAAAALFVGIWLVREEQFPEVG